MSVAPVEKISEDISVECLQAPCFLGFASRKHCIKTRQGFGPGLFLVFFDEVQRYMVFGKPIFSTQIISFLNIQNIFCHANR